MDLSYLAVAIPCILIALALHEFGHAAMSTKLGDPTPRLQGRLTLNPLAHLDPMGTVMILVTSLAGFGFGWGKPVQTNPTYYPNLRQGIILVALAGPAMNLCQASFALAVAYMFFMSNMDLPPLAHQFLQVFIVVNFVLMIFNLLPIPPLDGGHVLENLMPYRYRRDFDKVKTFGILILLGMMWLGVTRIVIGVVMAGLISAISFGFGNDFVAYLFHRGL